MRCGTCCRDLVTKDMGILRGLTLLPYEVQFFPKNQVKPAISLGGRTHDKVLKVVAYQLTLDECSHLRNNLCTIYENRPSASKQFPFSLELSEKEPLLGLDLNCPAVMRLLNANFNILFEERESAERLLAVKKLVAANPRRIWFYDLCNDKWFRNDQLIN